MIKALAAYKRLTAEFTRLLSQAKLLYSFLFRSTFLQLKDTEILKDIETLITPTNQDLYTRLTKIYIKFQQIRVKIKIHTSIIDLEFSMSFANLFIGLLVQRFLVFSSKGALLHITCHHFGHLKLLYRGFLLITSPNLSSFCRRVPYIHCGLLSSSYFYIQIFSGLHYLSLHNTRGRFFQFVFSGHNDQFQ